MGQSGGDAAVDILREHSTHTSEWLQTTLEQHKSNISPTRPVLYLSSSFNCLSQTLQVVSQHLPISEDQQISPERSGVVDNDANRTGNP